MKSQCKPKLLITLGVYNHFYHSNITFKIGSLCNSIVHQIWHRVLIGADNDDNLEFSWQYVPKEKCPNVGQIALIALSFQIWPVIQAIWRWPQTFLQHSSWHTKSYEIWKVKFTNTWKDILIYNFARFQNLHRMTFWHDMPCSVIAIDSLGSNE